MVIRDLGESGLLKLIQPYCLPNTIGDDGAIVHPPAGCELVVTTDVLVDRVHFSDRTTSAFDVGWRSVAANLSDLAAMGATPLGITVGLSLPPDLPVVWLERLYMGMQACLEQYGTGIIGGDLTRSTVTTVAITALGAVQADSIIRRSTARIGDSIVATGAHGNSHAGLQLLLDDKLGQDVSSFADPAELQAQRQILITAHQRPQPRLDVLAIVAQLRLNAAELFTISGMDSSDGLADAIVQICSASQVGARLDRASLPISPALARIFPATALLSALSGGEDFELVLCLPETIALQLVATLGNGAAIIGKITRSPEIVLVDNSGESAALVVREASRREDLPLAIDLTDRQCGFQHF